MSPTEIDDFIARQRIANLATIGRDGRPHLVAMWFGVIPSGSPESDGMRERDTMPELWFETKAKSQKAVNLRRDPRATVLIEAGDTYDQLRGVSIDATAVLYDDPESCLKAGISVWERYMGPYTDELRPAVEQMMHKRIAVQLVPTRIRSWDHRKLGLPATPLAGSTVAPGS